MTEADLDMMDDETDEEEEEELEEEEDWGDREFVSDVSGDEEDDGLSDLEDVVSTFLFDVGYILIIWHEG